MKQLDHILNLIKKLEEKEIDYFLVTLRHDKSGKKADVFYKFQTPESIEYVNEALESMEKEDVNNKGPAIRSPRQPPPKRRNRKRKK